MGAHHRDSDSTVGARRHPRGDDVAAEAVGGEDVDQARAGDARVDAIAVVVAMCGAHETQSYVGVRAKRTCTTDGEQTTSTHS